MKNTQEKAVIYCIIIMILAIVIVLFSMSKGYFAMAFIGIFIATSSFIIALLFSSRARCMAKMINGSDLIASWQYNETEVLKNIEVSLKERRGLWIIAVMALSFLTILVVITVGIAAKSLGVSFFITVILIGINGLLYKLFLVADLSGHNKGLKASDDKKKFVYISTTGIYVHGTLHVWKGWGSELKKVQYDPLNNILSFTYTYLRPYSIGRYTVEVYVPKEMSGQLEAIMNRFKVILSSHCSITKERNN